MNQEIIQLLKDMNDVQKAVLKECTRMEENQKRQELRLKEIERVLALKEFPTKQTFLQRIYGARNYRV